MLVESPLLASHVDREFTAAKLQEHVGAGRLTLEEFSDRAAAVYRSRTIGELQMLLIDLPTPAAAYAGPRRSSDWLRWAGAAAVVLLVAILVLALLSVGAWGSGGGHPADGMMTDMMGGRAGMDS